MARPRSASEDDVKDWRTILHRKNSFTLELPPQKPLQEREPMEFMAIIIGSSLLTYNAGFINGVTLLSSGITVSHVTGIITKSSIFLDDTDWYMFFQTLTLLPLFILGSTISGLFIPYSSFHLGRAYNIIFLIGSGCLLLSFLLYLCMPNSIGYVYVATIACGMQNAMTTRYSNNILRTTHMTGAATDIGIVFGRILVGRTDEAWRLKVLLPMMFAYFIGGTCGAEAAKKFGGTAVAFNFMIFSGTGLLYAVYIANTKHIPLIKAIFLRADKYDFHDRFKRRFKIGKEYNRKHSAADFEPTANPMMSHHVVHHVHAENQSEYGSLPNNFDHHTHNDEKL